MYISTCFEIYNVNGLLQLGHVNVYWTHPPFYNKETPWVGRFGIIMVSLWSSGIFISYVAIYNSNTNK